MKIITIPHPTLRQAATTITRVDQPLVDFVDQLQQTLDQTAQPKGVGLAAPQVDSLQRIFTTNLPVNNFPAGLSDDESQTELRYFINPRVVTHSSQLVLGVDDQDPDLEGCLSMPGLFGPVPRWQWVEIAFQILDLESKQLIDQTEKFADFHARVMLHELDHLDGILFTDHSLEYDLPVYRQENKQLVEIDRMAVEAI